MKFKSDMLDVACGCRSSGECNCNDFNWVGVFNNMVDAFSEEMKAKLKKKFMEGYKGWDDPGWTKKQIIHALRNHIEKGDMSDVANFAMFAWNRD